MMEKNSKIRLSRSVMILFNEGIFPANMQKYGINTYEELKVAIDSGEFEIESIPLQTELDL